MLDAMAKIRNRVRYDVDEQPPGRSARRCLAAGCAAQVDGDRLLCGLHARALAATVQRQAETQGGGASS